MRKDLRKKNKGFTLVELLVVVAIIGILIGATVISVRNIKAKSRDAERVSTIRSIATVLSLYHNDYNLYPIYEGYITGTDDLSVALKATGYINNVPTDPTEMSSTDCGALNGYHYYYQSIDGRSYILGYCLETNSMQGLPQGENYLSP